MPGKKRRLTDLYQRGVSLDFDDGNPELEDEDRIVTVWVAKPNPNEHANCMRRANAAKAVYLRSMDDHESEEWLAMYATIRRYPDREGLASIVAAPEISRVKARIEAELEADPEWAEGGRLQALVDAWSGDAENRGLKWRYAEDPEDPEAKRVFEELAKFDEAANLELKIEKDNILARWLECEDDELYERATDAMVQSQADEFFYQEYQYQLVYYSTRDPEDHKKRYFGTVDEVRELPEEIFVQLNAAINLLSVDALQGKDSPAMPPSSEQSEQPEQVEESSDSGLEMSTP